MKQVFQSIIDIGKGDCLRATLCSLLELDPAIVPNFSALGQNYFTPFLQTIRAAGCEYIGTRYADPWGDAAPAYTLDKLKKRAGIDGMFLATVLSPKYHDLEIVQKSFNARVLPFGTATHSIIIDKDLNVIHDPNPNYRGVKEYPFAEVIGHHGIMSACVIEKDDSTPQ